LQAWPFLGLASCAQSGQSILGMFGQVSQSNLVTKLGKYATISVPVEVKKRLEEAKGNKTWGEFLLEMCTEWQQLKSEKAFHELKRLLSKDDLKSIRDSNKEFREQFALR
jgi:predicted CopG family antitoxin